MYPQTRLRDYGYNFRLLSVHHLFGLLKAFVPDVRSELSDFLPTVYWPLSERASRKGVTKRKCRQPDFCLDRSLRRETKLSQDFSLGHPSVS